jgi:uncharacterized protein YjbI with pentapeptide repeats
MTKTLPELLCSDAWWQRVGPALSADGRALVKETLTKASATLGEEESQKFTEALTALRPPSAEQLAWLRDVDAVQILPESEKILNLSNILICHPDTGAPINVVNCQLPTVIFEWAVFAGEAYFERATFTGGVNFSEATFTGSARFFEVTFPSQSNTSFGGATFTGGAYFFRATFGDVAYFERATFTGEADFGGARFTGKAIFGKATFGDEANFEQATFAGGAIFGKATFTREANFIHAKFTGEAYFWKSTFTREANFIHATFTGEAYFWEATFTGKVCFWGATFRHEANFLQATFTGEANFRQVTFRGEASFHYATFRHEANFLQATFTGEANFRQATFTGEADFQQTEFLGMTIFREVRFTAVATFHAARFSKTVSFRDSKWEAVPDFKGTAWKDGVAVDDFKQLQTNLNTGKINLRQQSTSDPESLTDRLQALRKMARDADDRPRELDYFALELQARYQGKGLGARLKRCLVGLYGCLSDYGRGVGRPLRGLLELCLLSMLCYWVLADRGWRVWDNALLLSLLNALPPLGASSAVRESSLEALYGSDIPNLVHVIAVGEGVIGLILLFLIALGLRNRFRL